MESILDYMTYGILTENSIDKISVLDSCYAALSEGVTDTEVIRMTSSYTQSLITEVLENIKDGLLGLYQMIVEFLNNYILNTANLVQKYRNLIIERFYTLQEPFIFKTYEYPKLKDPNYPSLSKSSDVVAADVDKLQARIISSNMAPSQVTEEVHRMVREFGRDVIGGTPSMYGDLVGTVRSIVTKQVQGKRIDRKLTEHDISTFIDEICRHKEFRDDLRRTRDNIIADYEELKAQYKDAMERKEAESVGLKSLKYPHIEALTATERDRFASINLSMTQLFNGFITIYREAFNCKLQIMKDKVDANRAILVELMTRTNVLTTLSTKTPDRNRRPIVFDPGIKT